MKITVLNNQSVFDIAVRYSGSADAAFMIAVENNMSVTSTLTAGMELNIPNIVRKDVAAYFNSRNHQPATAWDPTNAGGQPKPEGISYWAISDDFVVTPQISIEP